MKTPFITKSTSAKTIKIGKGAPIDEQERSVTEAENQGQLPVDVLENKDEIRIIAPLAGVDIDEVEIVLNEDVLTISGIREVSEAVSSLKGTDYYAQECYWGPFSRSIILPVQAEPTQIEATQKNHILYIRIPKKPVIQMKIIKIRSK